MITEKSR